ncbi:MAG TPA: MupA/Atu3671 family FMN-dependent luciferase-like monooxygenase [Verrucomicrobiae bacterium]
MMPDKPAWPSFSLLFFASQQAEAEHGKFDLFRLSTRFADERGFEAVWIPERHFHAFGGMFPNPSLAAVVLAEATKRIRLRAGSVVMPLHHPIRVAEEWAVVDNLSNGRVDISFAIGWNPNDFVIAPHTYADRKRITFEGIEAVRKLWRGELYVTPNGNGEPVNITIHPLPLQKDLNVWFTCSGGKERFVEAGEKGFNIITALLFQSVEDFGEKVFAYRRARAAAGHAGRGQVTLMLHTFVGADEQAVKETVRGPFKEYLESSADLWQIGDARLKDMPPRKRADMLEYAFERYYQRTALMGARESCARMVEAVARAGADEIACLIDFGLPTQTIMGGLEHLDELRRAPGA